MAQTITFNGTTYDIEPDSLNPNDLVVTTGILKTPAGNSTVFLLRNGDQTTISNLTSIDAGYTGTPPGLNLNVRAANDTTQASATDSLFNFQSTNDTLVIGSSLNNTVNLNGGNDRLSVMYTSSG
ncbi:MAG: hypothetical protein VKK97_09465, partial [Synechococcaceae cyanobacterium]|nr:hypothetical protein [Synechococcaceae cyanobacterium]